MQENLENYFIYGRPPSSCLTHIIVDGVDQNDRFCDLLLLVLSEALTRYKMLKLIILSHADSPNAFK